MHAPLSIKNLNRIAGLLTLLFVVYAAATVWYTWADEKAEALRDMATIMEMEAKAFDNYFTHLELALKGLGDDLSSEGEQIDLDRAYVLVRKFHERHPELFNVTLIQADGTVLLTARNPPRTVHATLAEEASFIHFVEAVGQGQLFDIGRPLLGIISKAVIVPVRHAIKDRQGKLGYIISANLPHEHLQSYWIDSPLTTKAAIGLIRDSGFLLSRYPVPANLTLDQIYGVPRTGALIHHLRQQGFPERGYVEGTSSLDGPDFLTAFRRLPTHPLTLFIAMPLSEIRAAWWRRVSGTCFALLLLFGGGFTVYRDALRRQRAWNLEDQRQKEVQQQSERRLSAIIEALPVPTAISDRQHHVTYVNAAFTTAFGYPQQDLPSLAEWWARACPDPPYRQSVMDTWYARLDGLQRHAAPLEPLEVQVTTKRGERRTVLATASLLASPHDGSHLTTWYDITQRKALELALRASEESLRSIFQSMAEGLVLQCRDGRIVDANPAAETLLGLGREQLLGRSSVDPQWCAIREDGTPFPGDEHPGMVTLRTGKSLRDQIMGIKAPGHGLRWISINSQPVFADEQGLPAQVIATFVDVTEHRRAEAEILATKNQLQATLDAIPDVLFEVGVDGRIHHYHAQRSDLLAASPNLAIGKTLSAVLPAEAAEVCIDAIREAVVKGWSTGRAYRLSLPQGERWFELSVAPMAAAAGQVQRVIVLSRDITERKRLEAELDAARLQAEAASVAKSRFLATMSHEIRTPMHAILGMAQMLLQPGLNENQRQDYARIVLNSGQALLALLNDILDSSKIEAGSIELESVALRPREILDATQLLFSEAIHQKGLRFESEWSGPAAQRYLGDPYRLRQMLANLLANAVKFTEQGRIQLTARELERDATTAVLEFAVSDTGIGIPQDKQQGLFLPFAQADSSTTRQYGGTGLGLSIVSSLAKQMHGEVGVESEVGRGSRFWFRLRAGLPAAGGDGPVEERSEPSPSAARPAQMLGRVLVVDDSRSSRKVIEAMLTTLGLSVFMAENGQQAVDACLRGEAADLVLMDLHMPVLDGYDAAVRIRRWEVESAQPRHPIIALTADVKDENRQRCLAVDMDDFLCKPLVIETLAATLGRYLPSAATASQIPAPRSVDPRRVAALLGELEVLLAEGKFDAVGCFRSLQEAVAGTELAAELAETGRLLAEVRFDLALGELCRVTAAQGWRNRT